jgi:hypothetical protein
MRHACFNEILQLILIFEHCTMQQRAHGFREAFGQRAGWLEQPTSGETCTINSRTIVYSKE